MQVNDLQAILGMVPVLVISMLLVYIIFPHLLFQSLKGTSKHESDPTMMSLKYIRNNNKLPEHNADPSVAEHAKNWRENR